MAESVKAKTPERATHWALEGHRDLHGCWWSQFKGVICKGKFEVNWLKSEAFCFVCGIRCALLFLNIYYTLNGVWLIVIGTLFMNLSTTNTILFDRELSERMLWLGWILWCSHAP